MAPRSAFHPGALALRRLDTSEPRGLATERRFRFTAQSSDSLLAIERVLGGFARSSSRPRLCRLASDLISAFSHRREEETGRLSSPLPFYFSVDLIEIVF